jgi:hypothetical protein
LTNLATAATKLRRKISDKVLYLRDLEQHVDKLLAEGFNKELIEEYLSHETIKKPRRMDRQEVVQDINMLFDMGGVISGGAALSLIKEYPVKDVDFYFNDELSFVKAYLLTFTNPHIDICWYFDKPHELHDMGLVMCNAYKDRVEITPQAQEALDTGITDIYPENFIWPERTAMRMHKYHDRYGIRFKKHQVIAMIVLFGLQHLDQMLLEICVN